MRTTADEPLHVRDSASAPATLDVPPGVAHAARSLGLTRLTGIHPKARMWPLIIVSFAYLLTGAALLFALITAGEPEPGLLICGVVLVVIPIALVTAAVVRSPVFSRRARRYTIYTYAEGFVQVNRKGTIAYRWDRVAHVWQSIVRNRYYGVTATTNYRYRLEFADGPAVVLTHFTANMSRLGPLITDAVAQAQVPGAVRALRAGHTLAFGDIRLSTGGIGTPGKAARWTEISRVKVESGYVKLFRPGKRFTFLSRQCARIPNLGLFVYLSRSMAGGRPL